MFKSKELLFPSHPPVVEHVPAYKQRKQSFYKDDGTLQRIIEKYLPEDFQMYAKERLESFGKRCANEIDERARFTDREGQPQLQKYDAYGEDISEVFVNDGYKKTVAETYGEGIVGYVHKTIPELARKGNYTYSFLQGYLLSQTEPGFYCPVTLTQATAYLIDHYASEELKEQFLPHVCSTGDVELYEGATLLTERQGGSDVGENHVKAVAEGDYYRLYGEKYFASNAGRCGVAMVLARMEGAPKGSKGLTLFLVPWRKDDGTLNEIKIRRLKDKLGVKAVPSAEIELHGSKAYVVGDPKQGFYYMMEALNLSRICNAVASLGIMKRSYDESYAYANNRRAFGGKLSQYPMVQDSLMKMKAKLHVELATLFDMIQLYQKVTDGVTSEAEIALNRLNIAIIKKDTAYQAVEFAHQGIEMLGGNGYIEDFVTPRLLRDAQVLSVWEGTANILGLEVVRLVKKYDAHLLFITQINERIAAIGDNAWREKIMPIWEKIQTEMITYANLDYDKQTFYSKDIATKMNAIYETVVAVEWAIEHGGEFRSLAEIFVETEWGLRGIGDEMLTTKYYK